MTLQELFQRERAAIVESRTEISRTVEELFRKWNERLDDYEKRVVTTAMTGGIPSKSINENGKVSIPEPESIPEAVEIIPGLQGKPDRE